MEFRKQSQIELSKRFAALKNLNANEDINRTWENIKENIKISAKETLGLYGQKQTKMRWLQNPNQSNLDNLNNARHEASRHFMNKMREYLKAKINYPETNSKNKNIRELYRRINDLKKGYQPTTNMVKDDKGDLVADSHSMLNRWRNYFSQLLNVCGDSDVRQTEIHTEPLVLETRAFEVEMAIEKFKRYKMVSY
jgi:hypothetical protein